VQAWLEAWFSATGAALAATPIVITELTVDADATSPPEQAAPGVFLARLGPQERLHPRRLGGALRSAASPRKAGHLTPLSSSFADQSQAGGVATLYKCSVCSGQDCSYTRIAVDATVRNARLFPV